MTGRTLTAEQVKALYVGETVYMHGEDADGRPRRTLCVVAYHGNPTNKILTYRVLGQIKCCAIKDYPGKYYTRGA